VKRAIAILVLLLALEGCAVADEPVALTQVHLELLNGLFLEQEAYMSQQVQTIMRLQRELAAEKTKLCI
jgi:hypothetical protein